MTALQVKAKCAELHQAWDQWQSRAHAAAAEPGTP